ncbi:MAG TPA: hypothetical protein VLV86_07080, partial [Vicinamibacterales bacterium]|nr:hypothetical protein [Vicinamibacterales bacterium]
MKMLFLAVVLYGIAYVALKRRRFDFLAVAFLSSVVYFIPAVIGYVMFPVAYGAIDWLPIVNEAYAVMIVVLAATLIGMRIYDSAAHRRTYHLRLAGTESAALWALALAFCGLFMALATSGLSELMNPDKTNVLTSLNRWTILWEVGASLAAVMSFERRAYFLTVVSMLFLLFDVVIGFRVNFAITCIALLTLSLNDRGRQRFLVSSKKLVAVGMIVISFLFVYKQLFIAVKSGNWEGVRQSVTNPLFYLISVVQSEPFITQSILNEVVKNDFHVGMSHFTSVLYQFVVFSPSLGAHAVSFNDLFQSKLFPNAIGWGVANNIWAEMWSSGGWPLLGIFIVFYVIALVLMSRALRIDQPEVRSVLALISAYWAFYIHRNDLLVEVNLMKRVAIMGALVMFAAWLG